MKTFTNIDKFEDYIMEEKPEFNLVDIYKSSRDYVLIITSENPRENIAKLNLNIKSEKDLEKLKDIESLLDEILMKGYE